MKTLKTRAKLVSWIGELEQDFLKAIEMGFDNMGARLKLVNPNIELVTDGI